MDIFKIINELRIANRDVEFRIFDKTFVTVEINVILTSVNVEDLNLPNGYILEGNTIVIGEEKVIIDDIKELVAGCAYPDFDVYREINNAEELAIYMQELNPLVNVFLSEDGKDVYFDANIDEIAVPINYEFIGGVIISKTNPGLRAFKYTNKNINYKKTSYNKVEARQLSYLKDQKRILEDPEILKDIKNMIDNDNKDYINSGIVPKSDYMIISKIAEDIKLDYEERKNLDKNLDPMYKFFYRRTYAKIDEVNVYVDTCNDASNLALAIGVLLILIKNSDVREFISNNINLFEDLNEFLNFIKDLGVIGTSSLMMSAGYKYGAIIAEIKKTDLLKYIDTLNKAVEFDLQKDFYVRKKNKK
ncbi:MAG: hypothetical protein R3Y13_02010 [bacterium]